MFRNAILIGVVFGTVFASELEVGTMSQGQNSPFDC